jgi:outer membrane immunogenic protein
MRVQFPVAVAVALALSTAAYADGYQPGPRYAAPSGWNQWYIGGEVGDKWVNDDWRTNCVQAGGIATCGTFLNSLIFPGAPDATASHSFDTSGVRAGVYLGATYQVAPNWVMGIEGDYAFSQQSSKVKGLLGCSTFACALLPSTPAFDSTGIKNGDDFGLRMRAGFLVTRDVLVYGTGGVAFQEVEASMSCNGATSPGCLFSHSQTSGKWLTGATVGGGVEWKLFHNWLVRGEYRYADFGSFSPTFFKGSGDIELLTNTKVTTQIATFGLAYSFSIGGRDYEPLK